MDMNDPAWDDWDPTESKRVSDKTIEKFDVYLKEAGLPKLTKAIKKKIESAASFGSTSSMSPKRTLVVCKIVLIISGLSSKPRKATLMAMVSDLKKA